MSYNDTTHMKVGIGIAAVLGVMIIILKLIWLIIKCASLVNPFLWSVLHFDSVNALSQKWPPKAQGSSDKNTQT